MVPYKPLYLTAIALLFVTASCKKKEQASPNRCLPDALTVRTIVDADAIIKLIDKDYFIFEKNTIDTRLFPCSLAQEFKVNNLPVKITGEVKSTVYISGEPCCTDNFVILKISK